MFLYIKQESKAGSSYFFSQAHPHMGQLFRDKVLFSATMNHLPPSTDRLRCTVTTAPSSSVPSPFFASMACQSLR